MITIFKILIIAAIAIVGWNIASDQIPNFGLDEKLDNATLRVVEFVNPVAKEDRLITELQDNMQTLASYYSSIYDSSGEVLGTASASDNFIRDQLSSFDPISVVSKSQELIQQIDEINENKAAAISSQLDRIESLVTEPFKKDQTIDTFTYTSEDGKKFTCSLEE